MAAQPTNLYKLLRTPEFGSYYNVMATHLTNKATWQVFDIDNFGIMDVKTLNSVFSKYNKNPCSNAPRVLEIKIQRFFPLHRHEQGKFLHGQAFTAYSILPIFSNIKQEYTAASSGIRAEDKDVKTSVTPGTFNSS